MDKLFTASIIAGVSALGFCAWTIAQPTELNVPSAQAEIAHTAPARVAPPAPKPAQVEMTMPEMKIVGTKPASFKAPVKKDCDAHDEGSRDIGGGQTVHTYTFCG